MPLGPRLLLSELRIGGFDTEAGCPKPMMALLSLGLFVDSVNGATLHFSGDGCCSVACQDAVVPLHDGVNPLRPPFAGRGLGVVLADGATIASAGPGADESKSSGTRLFLFPEDTGVGDAEFTRGSEGAGTLGQCVSARELGRCWSGVLCMIFGRGGGLGLGSHHHPRCNCFPRRIRCLWA
jgi:hypothetical protein